MLAAKKADFKKQFSHASNIFRAIQNLLALEVSRENKQPIPWLYTLTWKQHFGADF